MVSTDPNLYVLSSRLMIDGSALIGLDVMVQSTLIGKVYSYNSANDFWLMVVCDTVGPTILSFPMSAIACLDTDALYLHDSIMELI